MKRARTLVALMALWPATAFAGDNYAHYHKALDNYRQQIYLSAVSEAQAQLRETPKHAPSWRLIARVYLTLKKCSEASTAAMSAYNTMAQSPTTLADQADMDTIFTDLTHQCGSSLDLARLYGESKDYPRASEQYRGYLKRNPDNEEAQLEYAHILSWAKNYPAAVEQYKRYLQAQPKDTQAMLSLADVYTWSDHLPEAEAQLKKVIEIDPDNGTALGKLGHIYEWRGQYKDAKEEYDKAVVLSPDNETAKHGQSRVKELVAAQGRPLTADDVIAQIHATGDQTLYLTLGDALYFNEGKVDEAIIAYKRFLREYPDNMTGILKLARVYGWEKRYDEAIPLFRQYLKKNPDDTNARMELANILSWSDHRSEALTELDLIKRQNPSMLPAYLAAGDILRWQRNFPESRDNYRKALKIDPDNQQALDGMREIDRQWTSAPIIRTTAEKVSISDIDFRRTSEGAQYEFHLGDGRIDLTPGAKAYQFKQTTGNRDGKEFYVNGGMPIQNEWRWWGSAGAMQFNQRAAQFQGSLGIEGTVSSHTWVRAGYTREDSVFESNNLNAILAGESLQLNSYDFQFAQTFSAENQIRGVVSAGFLTDGNSRTRMGLEGLHELTDAPIIKVGAGFKALTFARTSPLYWSPNAYSGPGLITQLERRWTAFSYHVNAKMYRIIQTSQTELSVEGGLVYQPRHGVFASLIAETGRGAGAAPQGTVNTLYQDTRLNVGYRF